MRIRSIKPKFWRSDDIDVLDWDTRLMFIALWSYVDDNGVGLDRLANIAADLFAGDMSREPIDTLAKVSRGLQSLSDHGRIIRYEVDGKPYLYIVNWDLHQKIDKPNAARFPEPTSGNGEIRESVASDSRECRETPSTRSSGEKENLKKTSSKPSAPGAFESFWTIYPRKVGKDEALKAFDKAVKRAAVTVVIEGATRYANDPNLPDREFIPHPATWLNGGRWDDEPCPPKVSVMRQPTNQYSRAPGERKASY